MYSTWSPSRGKGPESPTMSSDFGLKGPKTPWVCPNDRQLALRARLKTGWSVKTSQFNTYPKPQPLTEKEQEMIISVVKKAEELDLTEQKRVGKLVDRLESLKKLASGNGVTDCILCGDSFGLSVFGRSNYKCMDCKKAVCRKCVVELNSASSSGSSSSHRDSIVRLCKICSENRELIKRSGAWFYKAVPNYILPEKKKNNFRTSHYESSSSMTSNSEEGRYTSRYLNLHPIESSTSSTPSGVSKRFGILWTRGLRSQSECEDSSSGDEGPGTRRLTGDKFMFPRPDSVETREGKVPPTLPHPTRFQSPLLNTEDSNNPPCPADPVDPTAGNGIPRSSGSSSNDVSAVNSSITTTHSASPSSQNFGSIELTLLYDNVHEALNVSIQCCKVGTLTSLRVSLVQLMMKTIPEQELTPMDMNGLSDPFCVLNLMPSRFQGGSLRSKTVPKTLNPVFNETLTFYGLSANQLAWQTLQISVMDDDRWARDCLGFVQIPLVRIRAQQTRSFILNLEDGKLISSSGEWGRGSLHLSLRYLTEKSTLIVGLLRVQDLPLNSVNGASGVPDPYVKVNLVHVTASSQPTVAQQSQNGNRKVARNLTRWRCPSTTPQDFTFKVSIIDLPRLMLVISLWEREPGRQTDYIGGLVLGLEVSKGERLKHWVDMIEIPNTKHTKSHVLSATEIPAL